MFAHLVTLLNTITITANILWENVDLESSLIFYFVTNYNNGAIIFAYLPFCYAVTNCLIEKGTRLGFNAHHGGEEPHHPVFSEGKCKQDLNVT